MKAALRRIVMATPHVFGVGWGYRRYYDLALRVLTRRLAAFPFVEAVHVHRSYVSGGWIPGYSDLDVVVTVDVCDPEEDSHRLRLLQPSLTFLRRLFPIFGAVHVVTGLEIEAWRRWGGARRHEFSGWRVTYKRAR